MRALCHEVADGLDANLRQCCIRCGFPVTDYSAALEGRLMVAGEDTSLPRGFAGGRITVIEDGPRTQTSAGNTYWYRGAEHTAPDCEWAVAAAERQEGPT